MHGRLEQVVAHAFEEVTDVEDNAIRDCVRGDKDAALRALDEYQEVLGEQ